MLNLTIAIPVRNEEQNLAGCLKAIGKGFATKVVIIDSGSTDATCNIAKAWGAEVIPFVWNGQFPKKRNWFLKHFTPATSWVLFLDADEYLTPAFKTALANALEKPGVYVGFWLSYSIYFLGKPLKGGYPLNKLALIKVGAGEYERIDEQRWSHLDMEIHEHPVLNGAVGRIKAKIDHRDFRGVQHYVAKHNEYAWWEANRFLQTASASTTPHNFTFRQKLKYRLMKTPFIGPMFFMGSLFLLGGIRDGYRGFAFALLKMGYFTQVYCRIRELEDARQTNV